MYNPKDIIEILAQNVKKTKNPFGVEHKKLISWSHTLNLKEEGEYLLFTGLMYQMIPYVEAVSSKLQEFEDRKVSNYTFLGKYVPPTLSKLVMDKMVSKNEVEHSENVLKNIVKLLNLSNVDFYYKKDIDFYSGILLYDLGDEKYFKEHANFVVSKLKENNVEKIITVDPHTTYALKVLYPKYTNYTFEVKTYLELLNLEGSYGKDVTLHDPCFYARYLEISDIPRKILNNVGVNVVDIQRNGKFTHCCGGPAESLSPKLANEIRTKRISQLKDSSKMILTMCPICYANLKKESSSIDDIANYLAEVVVN